MSLTMLVLNINPELEEDLVDYLLGLDCIAGFTSYPVRGHGDHHGLSLSEQVTGRRKRLQTEMMVDPDSVETIIAGLRTEVGLDIVWWQYPVSAMGRV